MVSSDATGSGTAGGIGLFGFDWETIVEDVCVRGLPEVLWELAGLWTAQLTRIESIAQSLRDGRGDIAKVWSGPAGSAYAAHLDTLAATVDQTIANLKPVVNLLGKAADDLHDAMRRMPIPAVSIDDVASAHRGWLNHGCTTAGGKKAFSGRDSAGRVIEAGRFKQTERQSWLAKGWGEFLGTFDDWWQESFGGAEEEVRKTLQALENGNRTTYDQTAAPSGALAVGQASPTAPNLRGAAVSVPAHVPGTAPGAPVTSGSTGAGGTTGTTNTNTTPTNAGTGTTTSVGSNDPATTSYPGLDTSTLPETSYKPDLSGLAGVGSDRLAGIGGLGGASGLGAAGPGAAGLGAAGLGAGGLGAGGLGSGAGVGAGTTGRGLGAGLTPLAGIGTGVAGATIPSAAGRPMAGGMMGGAPGAAPGADGVDGRTNWLTEDEDIWGTDSDDLPPSLLG